jgi:RNA polymerase sigma-70 factor (ECF subfamily)
VEKDKQDLERIVKGCIQNDSKCQEELFKMLYGKMMSVCMRYSKDPDTAQEVLQVSFIKVFDKLEKYDFNGSFEGWVRRIVVNTAIDSIRKHNRDPFSTSEDYMFVSEDEMHTEDDTDTEVELKAEIAMEAVQQLSPAYQAVFNLYVIENYTHKEVAEILNISEGTSKSNLAKAKKKLQDILQDKYIGI